MRNKQPGRGFMQARSAAITYFKYHPLEREMKNFEQVGKAKIQEFFKSFTKLMALED